MCHAWPWDMKWVGDLLFTFSCNVHSKQQRNSMSHVPLQQNQLPSPVAMPLGPEVFELWFNNRANDDRDWLTPKGGGSISADLETLAYVAESTCQH